MSQTIPLDDTEEVRRDAWTNRPVVGLEETWTGDKDVSDRVVVGPGQTLVIEDADVTFHSRQVVHPNNQLYFIRQPLNIPGIHVLEGGELIVENSTLTTAPFEEDEAPVDRVEHPYEFNVEGNAQIADSVIEYAFQVEFDGEAATGTITDTEIGYTTMNGLYAIGANASEGGEPNIVLQDVHIHDTYGKYADFTGGLQTMATNIEGKNVRVEGSIGTGTVFLETTVSQAQQGAYSTVSFEDLVAINRAPEGLPEGASIFYFRYASNGTFECDRCTFVGTEDVEGSGASNWVSIANIDDGDQPDVQMRDLTSLNGALMVWAEGADRLTSVDGASFQGQGSEVWIQGGDDHHHPPLEMRDAALSPETTVDPLGQVGPVQETGPPPVDMRQNWWGHETGPNDTDAYDGSTPAENPDGQGIDVRGPVIYEDWLTERPTMDRPLTSDSPTAAPVSPGASTTVPVEVTNNADEAVTVPVELLDPTNAAEATLGATSLSLASGESVTVDVTVTVSTDAEAGDVAEVPVLVDGDLDNTAELVRVPVA